MIDSTSRQKDRLKDYLKSGDLKLSDEEIKSLDQAGAKYQTWKGKQRVWKALPWVVITCGGFALKRYWLGQ